MRLVIRLLINAVAIWVATLIVPGIRVEDQFLAWVVIALVFALVNALIRPVVQLLSLPITCLTLGLFTLVINALMLLLTSLLVGDFMAIEGGFWGQLGNALLAGIIISIVSALLSWLLPDKR